MQHLFQSWQSVAPGIREADHILLLSDYDGTLAPIAPRPAEALLPPGVRANLSALADRPAFSIGIISGRSLPEVRALVGLEGIYYAGNHGLEIEGPGLRFLDPVADESRADMKEIAWRLASALGGVKGIVLDDKGLSLSVHYRLVKAGDEGRAAEIFTQVTSPWIDAGKIKLTSGKMVWEVRPPVDWHKGRALEVVRQGVMAALKPGRLLTIYLGDDITDEDAFRAVGHGQGWGVYVGGENPASAADYFLDSVAEAGEFLSRLLDIG
ncbi:MAG: trehalose-phosphatase [Chloroflexota bacterium]